MGKSCKEIAQSLVDCMKKSECVIAGGNIKDCMNVHEDKEGKPTGGDCSELRTAYFQCKRSGLDPRSRIRGQRVY
jgi:cytochrome c oxidase assembly factor 5